jgi:glycosyltransferase involved in cell wall biosynthesis
VTEYFRKSDTPAVPAVSIVLTTFNRAHALAETLDAILAQSFKDFELIVCDDASSDDTPDVVRRYQEVDSRIRYNRNPGNLGMPENLNGGIRLARGAYIANLHDGDEYDPTLIEKWLAALDRHPNAAFVFNSYRLPDRRGQGYHISGETLPPVFPGSLLLEKLYFRRWRFGSPVWGTVMARRAAYVDAGLFDSRFGFVSDVDMWMRLAESNDVAYIAEPLISIPSRKDLPRAWSIPREHATIQRMVWEARMRHYRGKPLRRIIEAGRHFVFVAMYALYRFLIVVNARVKRLRGPAITVGSESAG